MHTYTKHSMITCRSWSQEARQTFPWVWPLNHEPADLQGDAVALLVIVQSTQKPESVWFMSVCFCPFPSMLRFLFEMSFTIWNHLTFLFSLLFSLQSSEQKQTPVSPRASLPVQPQTRTAVSTPFLVFPSLHPAILLSSTLQSLADSPSAAPSLPFSVSFDVLHDPFENMATVQCQNFYPGWGFKSRARWHSAALCSCQEVKKSVCVRCVCVCVYVHAFKRWKCAWSECFAWTCEEFLFGNMEFSQSIQSVRAGHTDAEKPPTCLLSLLFFSHSQTCSLSHSLFVCFSPIDAPTLSPFLPLCCTPVCTPSFHSGSLFVLSSESLRQLRLKVETPS